MTRHQPGGVGGVKGAEAGTVHAPQKTAIGLAKQEGKA
jgi:hypothetical protein